MTPTVGPNVVYAPAPADPRDWHRNLYGHRWTRGWGLGWGRLHGPLARRFSRSADRHLVQVEVFGRFLNVCR